jgi:hypothetical protein
MTFAVFVTNGLVQFVPIDPVLADRIIVGAVTTSVGPVTRNVALSAVMLYVAPAMLSTPHVVSLSSVIVPVAMSFANTLWPAALASKATVFASILIGVVEVPIDPPVDIIDTSFAVIVPDAVMFPAELRKNSSPVAVPVDTVFIVTGPVNELINDMLPPAVAVIFGVSIANGVAQLVPIEPLVADRTIAPPPVTTSPGAVTRNAALFPAKLYVPLAILSTPHVVSAANVIVPVALSVA